MIDGHNLRPRGLASQNHVEYRGNSSTSRVTQNLQITDHNELFPKFMVHGNQNQLITHHENTPVRSSLPYFPGWGI